MGAKQSKRSVDISGKEAEGAGEVAAAGAGGEGRMEPLADADALKPQLNGDAHILEQTDKEKELDSGTPENEKDATTEKEAKQQEDEKEAAPATNGETEQKENGETTPTSEDGKKPKAEKVKKKWSLRSISFSRKDKPKQEKKKKEEEPKTNGEPEKVPEETAEVAPETAEEAASEDSKPQSESKPEDKTPETPVTEPITNGSTTPESPKIETPATEEAVPASPEVVTPEVASPATITPEVASPATITPEVASPATVSLEVASPEAERPEPKAETEPEQLPVNGLSLEESKESPEVGMTEESKPEEPTAETTEIVPETPVIKEVCVDQMPLIEPTPPPLPANPPPSSVASFAATTMAPELTDASLANTADTAIPTLPADSNTKDTVSEIPSEPEKDLTSTQTAITESPTPLKQLEEISEPIVKNITLEKQDIMGDSAAQDSVPEQEKEISEEVEVPSIENEIKIEGSPEVPEISPTDSEKTEEAVDKKTIVENIYMTAHPNTEICNIVATEIPESLKSITPEVTEKLNNGIPVAPEEKPENKPSDISELLESKDEIPEVPEYKISEISTVPENEPVTSEVPDMKPEILRNPEIVPDLSCYKVEVPVDIMEVSTDSRVVPSTEPADIPQDNSIDDLPPPPPPICDEFDENACIVNESIGDSNSEKVNETKEVVIDSNHASEADDTTVIHKESSTENAKHLETKAKDALGNLICTVECNGNSDGEAAPADDPADATPAAQDPLPMSDKISELIPEVPAVPELKTEMESPSDVAVAN